MGVGGGEPLSSSVLGFFKLVGVVPTVTRADFTQVLYDSTWLSELNPTLPSRLMTFDLLLYWHGCCVLEDKLERLCSFRDERTFLVSFG